MDLIDWIPTTVTAIATIVVAAATIHYARTLKNTEIKAKERPRKEDEINSIIEPLISTCNGEISQLSHKWYDFLEFELFSENIRKNNYKRMIFNDFIKGKNELVMAIKEHEKIIRALAEKHQVLVDALNTDEFRMKIKKLREEFNQKNPHLKFSREIDSLSKQIIRCIIENKDVNEKLFGDPFEDFWKINRKYFLNMRKQKELKKYLEEMEILSNQLIEKNKFILKNLENILNKYTKEYGLSLEKNLIDFY